jgi:deoxycytidylate deaminase
MRVIHQVPDKLTTRSRQLTTCSRQVHDKKSQPVDQLQERLSHMTLSPSHDLRHSSLSVCDAQTNAILFRSVADLCGCVMYTTCFPNWESAKILIQSKIQELYYMSHGAKNIPDYESIKQLLEAGCVKTQ